ncbi:DMT family transporter [Shewanella sp. SP2S2-6]|uniref:DMT family transporter n=1 Tax=Shewanella sp. SP2S2-6 TaxID=3063540 RepID=UPI00288D3E6C|nr:DMT family transporter [Shewanella sp. SP2S2-6]MDT3295068.1 DMT family transporter [Shewanella sp. SP2S2-6]
MQSSNKFMVIMPLAALFSGALLALMIKLNSQLALYSSPLMASWIAHGVGILTVLLMLTALGVWHRFTRKQVVSSQISRSLQLLPWWAYLGGLPGALTVVLAAMSVNSDLALAGTLALMLVGQLVFSCLCDRLGYLGMVKRHIPVAEIAAMVMISLGAILVIFSRY